MDYLKKINQLLRREQVAPLEEIKHLHQDKEWVQVDQIILNNDQEESVYKQLNTGTYQLISSCVQIEKPISVYMYSQKGARHYGVAYSGEKIETYLEAAYPDSVYRRTQVPEEMIKELRYHKLVTGIPRLDKEEFLELKFDGFMKLIQHKNVLLKITAKPIDQMLIDEIYESLLKERAGISGHIESDLSDATSTNESNAYQDGISENKSDGASAIVYTKQEARTSTVNNTYTSGNTTTHTKGCKVKDYSIEAYDLLLEEHMKRVEDIMKQGGWETTITLFAENPQDLKLAHQALEGILIGGFIEPLGIHTYQGPLTIIDSLKATRSRQEKHVLYRCIPACFNIYTKQEVTWFMTPYMSNVNGFTITRRPRFLQQSHLKGGIYLGNLLDYSKDTGNRLNLSQETVNKHILVAGMTGSGKTNTVFSLLRHEDIPFLVIEPAKTEYRVLGSLIPDLRIYTLGREHISPFRLNPFQFDCEHISIQEHIDNLKVIFTAAFTMYASMPNILEQCLVNIYTKKGWNLVTSRNVLCKGEIEPYFYPTMEELYVEIDTYIDALGYAQEQNQNIRAALLTRIKSLMTGSKGFMLNTNQSINMEELLKYPTVLELEGIADDTEKALMIGFIMLQVYEYVKANTHDYKSGLKHTIVIEEAHRLFANVSSSENQEQVNMRGKAVETLSNMLCEIRAYGEGFIVIDQVPVKLAPDVLKNTNTKIIHRLVSKDDCEYVAKAIQIAEENVDFIPQLKVGQALVYTEGLEETAHIQIQFNKDQFLHLNNNQLHEKAKSYNRALHEQVQANPIVETLLTYPDTKEKLMGHVKTYINTLCQDGSKSVEAYNEVKKFCIQEALLSGFTIEDHFDAYTHEMTCRVSSLLINKSKWSNNLVQKQRFMAMIESGLRLGANQAQVKVKEIEAFKVAMSKGIIRGI